MLTARRRHTAALRLRTGRRSAMSRRAHALGAVHAGALLALGLSLCAACSDDDADARAGGARDAGAHDAATRDAAARDAGPRDSGARDVEAGGDASRDAGDATVPPAGECRGEIDCSRTPCRYERFDPSKCPHLTEIREGRCGNVRFRVEEGLEDWSVSYWDATTGELLARIVGNDIPTYCDETSFAITLGDATIPPTCPWQDTASRRICWLDSDDAGAL